MTRVCRCCAVTTVSDGRALAPRIGIGAQHYHTILVQEIPKQRIIINAYNVTRFLNIGVDTV